LERYIMIYLDNAATTWPKPESVYRAMDDFVRNKAGNPGRGSHSMASAATGIIQDARKEAADLINTPDIFRIIFTLNCTHSLNMGLKGILKPGDHVVTDSIGHNSMVRPLKKLQKWGITVTRVAIDPETGYTSAAAIEAAIKKETRMIAVTHGSNVNGVIQPVEEYGRGARGPHLIFLGDGAQTAGVFPIDVQGANIDLLALAGHKSLYGPPGTGLLYVGERADLDTLTEGGTGSYSEFEDQPVVLPDKYEAGTMNSVGIAGLGAGLKFIRSEGMDKIRGHELALSKRLIEGLSGVKDVVVYTGKDLSRQAPVVSFTVFGYLPPEIGVILDKEFDIKIRAGLLCAPGTHRMLNTFPTGTVRVSPGYFNTAEEIDILVKAVDKIRADYKDNRPVIIDPAQC
jgi:cysteine desulfurase family protein